MWRQSQQTEQIPALFHQCHILDVGKNPVIDVMHIQQQIPKITFLRYLWVMTKIFVPQYWQRHRQPDALKRSMVFSNLKERELRY